ncbi:MAG TPA: hypothetical protein VK775_01725 [Chthoniobacterales bacterium]|nr:hypothetical protein [Chthoniobacterales bacterium]
MSQSLKRSSMPDRLIQRMQITKRQKRKGARGRSSGVAGVQELQNGGCEEGIQEL